MMKNHVRKILALAITTTFICLTLSGMTLAADTIKLGVAGPHSGDLASYGIPTIRAAAVPTTPIQVRVRWDCPTSTGFGAATAFRQAQFFALIGSLIL